MHEPIEDLPSRYANEDKLATQKDLRILTLELEAKMTAIESRLLRNLGTLIIGCSGIVFGLLMFFHR